MLNDISLDLFIKTINGMRRLGGWYAYAGLVEGRMVRVKGYGTWLQTYQVDGVTFGGLHDRKVGQFKTDLLQPFEK